MVILTILVVLVLYRNENVRILFGTLEGWSREFVVRLFTNNARTRTIENLRLEISG